MTARNPWPNESQHQRFPPTAGQIAGLVLVIVFLIATMAVGLIILETAILAIGTSVVSWFIGYFLARGH